MSETDKQIEYQVLLDESKAINSANDLARYIASLSQNVQTLENNMRSLLSGQFSRFESYAKRLSQVSNPEMLQNLGAMSKAARVLSTGGAETLYRGAAQKGMIANLRTDEVAQLIQLEKEQNRVLEARAELYRRMRANMPDTATQKDVAEAWVQQLKPLFHDGLPNDAKAYNKWAKETRAEALKFEKQITADKAVELAKRTELEQSYYDRYARRAVGGIARLPAEQRGAQMDAVVGRLQTFAGRRGSEGFSLDSGRLRDLMTREVEMADAIRVAQEKIQNNTRETNLRRRVGIERGEIGAENFTEVELLERELKSLQTAKADAARANQKQTAYDDRMNVLRRQLSVARGEVSYDDLTEEERIQRNLASVRSAKTAANREDGLRRRVGIEKGEISTANFTEIELLERELKSLQVAKADAAKNNQKLTAYEDRVSTLRRQLSIARGEVSFGDLTEEERLRREIGEAKVANKPVKSPRSHAEKFIGRAEAVGDYMGLAAILSSVYFASTAILQLETGMKDLQAITQATDLEMKSLGLTIRDIGSNSKFSLSEIVEGAKVLAQAGYSSGQIRQSLQPIMEFSAATGSDLKSSVETVTSVLAQFNLSLERTGEVANVMTSGLNVSKLNAEQLALGIQYAGNQAALSNVRFEEMVAALGAMSNAGIRSGSTLGTGLRALMAEFDHPSKKFVAQLTSMGLTVEDVNLKTHSLAQVMNTLTEAGFTYTNAIGSFEIRSAAAFSALQNNLPALHQMEVAMNNSSAASAAAAIQMDTVSSQWQRLLNVTLSFASEASGPVLGVLKMLLSVMADMLTVAQPLAPAFGIIGTSLAVLAATMAAMNLMRFVQGLLAMNAGFQAITVSSLMSTNAVRAFALAATMNATAGGLMSASLGLAAAGIRAVTMALLASPMAIFVVGVTAAVTILGAMEDVSRKAAARIEELKTSVNDAGAEVDRYQGQIDEVRKAKEVLIDRSASLARNTQLTAQEVERAQSRFGAWGLEIQGSTKNVYDLINALGNLQARLNGLKLERLNAEKTANTLLQGELDKQLGTNMGDFKSYQGRRQGSVFNYDNTEEGKMLARYIASGGKDATASNYLATKSTDKGLLSMLKARSDLQGQKVDATTSGIAIDSARGQGVLSNRYRSYVQAGDRAQEVHRFELSNAKTDEQTIAANKKYYETVKGFGSQLRADAAKFGDDPNSVMAALETYNPGFSGTMAQGGNYDITPVAVLKERRASVNQSLTAAKRGKNKALIAELDQERNQLDLTISRKEHPDWTAEQHAMMAAEIDNRPASQPSGGGGFRPDRNMARVAGARAKAIETMIETAAAGLGPTVDDMLAGKDQLLEMLAKWKEAKAREVRASTPPEELQNRLDDLDIEAEKYFNKVIEGNATAAKELLVLMSERSLKDATNAAGSELQRGGGLQTNLADVKTALDDLLEKRIDAYKDGFRAKNNGADPDNAATAIEHVKGLRKEALETELDTMMGLISSYYEGLNAALSDDEMAADLGIERRMGAIDIREARYGQTNYSTRDRDAARRDQAKNAVTFAERGYDNAVGKMASIQGQLDKDPNNKELTKEFEDQRRSVAAMAAELERAQLAYSTLLAEAPEFNSYMEAMGAAWQDFVGGVGESQLTFESLKTSLDEILHGVSSSLSTALADIVTGTQSVGSAFKSMAKGILNSLLKLATDIVANQVLMWVLSMFGYQMTGGTGVTISKIPAPEGKAQGGLLRMAQGSTAPFRDSKLFLGMPGEFVMRKSAVDMIGADTLTQLNTMGNRRLSAVPTVASAMPQREPDTANVWIVAPETKPSMTGKDVLAIVHEDMLSGGTTKKLVKSVAMGVA